MTKRRSGKFATRYLLLTELCLAWSLLTWGIAGCWGSGSLWFVLSLQGANVTWAAVLVPLGGAYSLVCAAEWLTGRCWPPDLVFRSIRARCAFSFLSAVVWLYVGYMALTIEGVRGIVSLMMQAPLGFLLSAYAFYGNEKIRCVLDPACESDRLERSIMVDRKEAAR